jgi:hypothetical protein
MSNIWSWETRRPNEPTTDYLGRVLEDYLGLREMAKRAYRGHFDEFFCPTEIADGQELERLVHELFRLSQLLPRRSARRGCVLEVMEAVMDGEFNATRAESDRWIVSKEGQEMTASFPPHLRRKIYGV